MSMQGILARGSLQGCQRLSIIIGRQRCIFPAEVATYYAQYLNGIAYAGVVQSAHRHPVNSVGRFLVTVDRFLVLLLPLHSDHTPL
jgi:hypothetical protein